MKANLISAKKISAWIPIVGFFTLLIGIATLPEPYSSWAGCTWLMWFAGMMAAALTSVQPVKPLSERIKSAVVVCVIWAGIEMVAHAAAWTDGRDGHELRVGFNRISGQGVKFFVLLFVGSSIGIIMSERPTPGDDEMVTRRVRR